MSVDLNEEYNKIFKGMTSEQMEELAKTLMKMASMMKVDQNKTEDKAEDLRDKAEQLEDLRNKAEQLEIKENDYAQDGENGSDVFDMDIDVMMKDTSERTLQEKQATKIEKELTIREQKRAVRAQLMQLSFARRRKEIIINVMTGADALRTYMMDNAKMYGARAQKCAEDYLLSKDGKKPLDKEWSEAQEEIHNQWLIDQNENYEELHNLHNCEEKQEIDLSESINNKEWITLRKEQFLKSLEAKKAEIINNHKQEWEEAVKNSMFSEENTLAEVRKKIQKEYQEYTNILAKEHGVKNVEEVEKMYDKQIKEKDTEIKKMRTKLREIRQDIEECKNRIKERDKVANEQRRAKREELKERYLAIPKQSPLQRIIGMIYSKFGGKNKFQKNVINNIQDEIEKMQTEDLAEAQEETEKLRQERKVRENGYEEKYLNDGEQEIKPWNDRNRREESRARVTEIYKQVSAKWKEKIQQLKDEYEQKQKDGLAKLLEKLAEEKRLNDISLDANKIVNEEGRE